jgi:hypothetical protein
VNPEPETAGSCFGRRVPTARRPSQTGALGRRLGQRNRRPARKARVRAPPHPAWLSGGWSRGGQPPHNTRRPVLTRLHPAAKRAHDNVISCGTSACGPAPFWSNAKRFSPRRGRWGVRPKARARRGSNPLKCPQPLRFPPLPAPVSSAVLIPWTAPGMDRPHPLSLSARVPENSTTLSQT